MAALLFTADAGSQLVAHAEQLDSRERTIGASGLRTLARRVTAGSSMAWLSGAVELT
jgi:hypothetical protein